MVLVVANEVHIVCRAAGVLWNAAALPALPLPQTALVGDLFCTSPFL